VARVVRFLILGLALGALPLAASAEPITSFLGATLFTTAAGTAITVGTALTWAFTAVSVASSVYGSVQAKKQARAAAERKFQQEVASLQDRTTTIVASDDAWPVVYGQPAPFGGSIKAVLGSGDKAQFKHVVIIFAAHECEAIDDVYIDGESLMLDEFGTSQNPTFQVEYGVVREVELDFAVQRFEQENVYTGEITYIYAALVDTSALGQIYDPHIIAIKRSNGADLTNKFAIVNSNAIPGQMHFPGIVLMGDQTVEGATGKVTLRIEGAGSALHISKHLSRGGVDVADQVMMNAIPLNLWTADHKLSGYTYIVATLNLLLERFQGGMPAFTARIRGKRVLDPRTGQIVYSRNPALCLADFLRSECGYLALDEQIDQNALIAAANACDQVVYGPGAWNDRETYGNDTRRYVCDGIFRSDQDRDTTRQQLEDAMAGFSLESGGVWRILAGAWSTPVLALADDDMLGPASVIQTANPGQSRFNGARGVYVNQGRNGVSEDITPYVNAVFRAADAKEKWLDLPLSFTASHARAHQLARVRVEQSRGGFVLQIQPKMLAWHLQPGDRITLSSGLYGFTNKRFRVQDWTFSQTSPLALQVVEDEESFYDLADETQADPAPNTNLPNPFAAVAPPQNLDVVSEEIQQSGTLVYRARVFWDPAVEPGVLMGGTVRIEWRRNLPNAPWQTTELPGDATQTYLTALEVGAEYEVRVRFQSRWTASTYARIYYVFTGKSRVPEDVAELTVSVEGDGVYARWASPEGLDLLDWSVSEVRIGPTWDAGTTLWRGKATVANLGWLPAGDQAIWVVHRDRERRESIPRFAIIQILPPAQPLPEATVSNRNTVHIAWQDCKTTQPLRHYEVRYGFVFPEATVVGLSGSTVYSSEQLKFGNHRYWVVAVDVAGNRSAAGYADATTLESFDAPIRDLRGWVRDSLDEAARIAAESALNADDQAQRVRAIAVERTDILKEENKALVTKFTALSVTVDQNQAIISSQLEVIATNLYAQARRIDIVAAVAGENTAAIVDERHARADADSALASSIITVQSIVGGLSSTVDIQANTVANLNGNVAAQYMVRTEVIGATGKRAMAGLLLGVSSTSGGASVQSEVIVIAGQFLVAPDTGSIGSAPFKVVGGITYIDMAMIREADIGTLKIAGRAITQPAYAESRVSAPLPVSGIANSLFIYGFDSGGEFVQVSVCVDADAERVRVAIFLGGVEMTSMEIKSSLQFGFQPPAGAGDYVIVFNDATSVGAGNTRFKSVNFLGCKR
jgi:Domain of unknown function (DUF1983)